jgi:hypothetical protein
MLLTSRPNEVITLRDSVILILDTGQLGKDFVVMSDRPSSRVPELDRAVFPNW